MACPCHEPAVFGHLECDLAPRGHVSEHAARLRRAMVLNQEMDWRKEAVAEVNRTMPHRSQLVKDMLNGRLRYSLE